jgi:hypothetical protein
VPAKQYCKIIILTSVAFVVRFADKVIRAARKLTNVNSQLSYVAILIINSLALEVMR